MKDFFASVVGQIDTNTFHYFDGKEWNDSESGKTVDIVSPMNGERIGMVQRVTSGEIDRMIEKATSAQRAWEKMPLHKRVHIVKKAAQLIRDYKEDFIHLLVEEIGKSKEESASEVARTADLTEYFCQEVQSLRGEYLDSDNFPGFEKGRMMVSERVAHGVVLAIGPFNYPINLSASKFAPALLMGNAVIFKPPTQGSMVGSLLTQCFVQAGLPEGVFSLVTGQGRDIGEYLVSHTGISMIAFTGSSTTGEAIAKRAGMKPLLFECGGNNAVIVLPDADLEFTAKEIVKGGYAYAGQRCTGIKYILGTENLLEHLLPEIVKKIEALTHIGDPREETTRLVGPVISSQAAHEIMTPIEKAIKEGATVVTGGKRTGNYIEPTLLSNVTPTMDVVAEEVFGPVVSCITVADTKEAISIVNRSRFGLQASIFTKDEGTGIQIAKELQVGTVQINGSPQRGPDHFPFMGIKASGLGVQGVRYSLEAMSRLQSIVINNPE